MTDSELAKRVVQGDPEATAKFVDLHYGSVYRYARVLSGHDQDAEDLAVRTILKAKNGLAGFRGSSGLRSWVHSIAYREVLAWRKRQEPVMRLSGTETIPDHPFRAVDDAEALRLALAQIPEGQRQAFVMFEILEMELKEVARALRVPQGTVKSRLFHAKRALREQLTPKQDQVGGRRVYES